MTDRAEEVARHYQRPGLLDSIDAGPRSAGRGGGIGGPARMLASAYGADVTVLDLTPEFCRVGEALTARLGLADRVRFRVGDALRQPFEAGVFDLVWTHASWAPSGEISFLLPAAELRSTIAAAGFRETEWRDVTGVSAEWLHARFGGAPPAGPPPVLTPHVVLGDGFRPACENLLRNLDEHRVRVVEAVFQRDG